MRHALPAFVLVLALGAGALAQPKAVTGPAVEQENYGKLPDTKDKAGKTVPGPVVTKFTLVNKNGMVVKCIEYGAIITEIHVADKAGKMADVALGFDKLEDYLKGHPYFGTNAGRCANRVANAKFKLEDKEYKLEANNGPHALHGGKEGFDKKYWRGEASLTATGPSVKFSYTSPDGEEGYPGQLSVTVSYTLTDNNEIVIDFRATTNKTTICNLAHHSYFNLAGHNSGDIKGHELTLAAKNYTPGDETLVPTGKIIPVAGTAFDFTKAKSIGADLEKVGGKPVGFDLNFVLDKGATAKPELAARVVEPKSGRVMEVLTTEPGLQFYTGNFLDGTNKGKGGAAYKQYNGFCLEAQKFPDSVNKPEWKDKSDVVLKPGDTYKQTTIYQFSVAK
ncbi:MAG: galactose mutarotase [Gemmataceae bacterium]|nr:galactose mutarotase [Gemmataceae bacterium]